MKFAVLACGLLLLLTSFVRAAEPKLLVKVTPLPVALSDDFEFRKTKLFFLDEKGPKTKAQSRAATLNPGAYSNTRGQTTVVNQDTSVGFERSYRLFGAVTKIDQRQRFGDYFDFFWRAKRPADLTVRLEYRQQKLHDLIQAQEISYANIRGTHKTEFKVIGDDYVDDGRVIAWRCVLIENGRIVAERQSYMWE